jgi:hypothetical protein
MPKNRREFERNMFILSEGLQNDLVKISRSNTKAINGLVNVRFCPNRRPNVNTVDEISRLVANTIGQGMLQKGFKTKED